MEKISENTVFYNTLTNLKPISKTLRFRLIPKGKTDKTIENLKLLDKDFDMNREYPYLKDAIDDFYRYFIKTKLQDIDFDWSELEIAYNGVGDSIKKSDLEGVQKDYRARILGLIKGSHDNAGIKLDPKQKKEIEANADSPGYTYEDIFKKKLISDILPEFLQNNKVKDKEEKINSIYTYNNFTTRLTNFWEARKNIFSSEDISTAIPFRLVHDNFPLFLENIKVYDSNKELLEKELLHFENKLKEHAILKDHQSISDYFEVEGFNLVCTQAGIDVYNAIKGGFVTEHKEKVTGINELLNLKQQQLRKSDKKVRFGKLASLKKQILEHSESTSFLIDKIENDFDLYDRLSKFNTFLNEPNEEGKSVYDLIEELNKDLDLSEAGLIWINAKNISNFSNTVYGEWDAIRNGFLALAKTTDNKELKGKITKLSALNNDSNRKSDLYFSLQEIQEAIMANTLLDEDKKKISIIEKFKGNTKELIDISNNLFAMIKDFDKDDNLISNFKNIEIIKKYLDNHMEEYHKWKVFELKITDINFDYDDSFYPTLINVLDNYYTIIKLYDLTRNYLTRKPTDEDKIKVNFNIPTLAKGWSESKIADNKTMIFRKDNLYYLGIFTNLQAIKDFTSEDVNSNINDYYEKIVYRYFPGASKMIPKTSLALNAVKDFFSKDEGDSYFIDKKFMEPFEITREDYDLQYNLVDGKKKYQIDYLRNTGDEEGYMEALNHWIEFSKRFLRSYEGTSYFNYSSLDEKSYTRLDQFYKDVDALGYSFGLEKVSSKLIDKMVEEEDLLLFQIYNKDFSDQSKGKKNLHTLYWLGLFSEENMKTNNLKLNGEAEIFLRKKQRKPNIVHEKGSKLLNKFDKYNNPIESALYDELYKYVNEKIGKEELSNEALQYIDKNLLEVKDAKFDIVKDRRFTEDQIFFHVPITFNWTANTEIPLNYLVNAMIKENDEQYIIGIDRGERHLLYYSVIDSKGNIVEQGSLNNIDSIRHDGEIIEVPYNKLLTAREKERADARVNWQSIEKIKDLKDGYLSHVVYKLSSLIDKYNAIVVLENLNIGFKRGRFKVERQVYQKFEMALMNKLASLSFKERDLNMPGGILNPLQLCNPVNAYSDLRGQNGIVFYLQAAYTSVVDPVTGFANLFSLNIDEKEYDKFINNLISLTYLDDEFVFKFNYNDFSNTGLIRLKNIKDIEWEVSTRGERISYNRRKKENFTVDLSESLKNLFKEHGIEFDNSNNILEELTSLEKSQYNKVVKKIIEIFRFTLQLRNTDSNQDYIISPVKNKDGYYYDSREVTDNKLPLDGDANGAYNIARKGLLYLNRLKASEKSEASIFIDNESWFDFIM